MSDATQKNTKARNYRRDSGPDIRKIAAGTRVEIKAHGVGSISGRIFGFGAKHVKIRQGAGFTDVNLKQIYFVKVAESRSEDEVQLVTRAGQASRILSRYP